MFYHNTSADETRRGLEQNGSSVLSSPFHLDEDVITECQNGANISSAKVDTYGAELSSATEAAHVRYPDEHSAKQSIMYRKPPYTLGHSSSLSQNLAENGSREYHSQGLERKSDEERGTSMITGTHHEIMLLILLAVVDFFGFCLLFLFVNFVQPFHRRISPLTSTCRASTRIQASKGG